MSLDWTYEFCLVCDKQTDGTAYCSESCRLAEYEQHASSPGSGTRAPPSLAPWRQPWFPSKPGSTSTRFHLAPAVDFGRVRPVDTRLVRDPLLSPSHSHTSLCSLRSSSSSSSDATQLSDKAARQLRAYARSFESVRLKRRPSQ